MLKFTWRGMDLPLYLNREKIVGFLPDSEGLIKIILDCDKSFIVVETEEEVLAIINGTAAPALVIS